MAKIINHHGNVEEVSAPAFTPGPWEAADRGDYSDYDGNSRVILGDDMRIAVVQHHGTKRDEANAHLIASAPDGFDAGEEAIVALNAMMDAWFDYHDSHSLTQPVTGAAGNAFDKALAAREKLEAFIAKALGEQQ